MALVFCRPPSSAAVFFLTAPDVFEPVTSADATDFRQQKFPAFSAFYWAEMFYDAPGSVKHFMTDCLVFDLSDSFGVTAFDLIQFDRRQTTRQAEEVYVLELNSRTD